MDSVIDILLVDDEPRNLDALEAILFDPGYRLIRAGGGDEALRLLLDHDVAAIVLDIRMPGVTGFELAQIIKGTKKFRQIPIVFLTAHMMEDQDVITGYGAGAVDYLTKPFNPQILRHKISVFADLFRKTRALAELNETLEARVSERTAELEKSEAALRATARQKDEFLATLAHELRNPLAPLRLGLDLLLDAQPPSEEVGRMLAIMNRQLDHMVRLIDDLLDVARISGGMLELKKERTDLFTVVENAVETCRPFFEQRGQKVSIEATSSLMGLADSTRLVQIVGNLLHNASKFTPEGGQVKIELTHENGRALIRVVDSGVGIPPDQLPRVFDMFTRIERPMSDSNGGLGIGLALSRRLAEMHGGELTAASPGVGQGSVFTLSVPADVGTTEIAPDSVRPPARSNRRMSVDVVVIEDNHDVAEMLAMALESRGYRSHVAHTGPNGLELVREIHPQVVLCDIGLPGMDGNEVCRQIRQLEVSPDYKPLLIALTGWGMEQDRRRTQETGFDHHLVKPVLPETLFELLNRVGHAVAATT